MTAGTGKTTVMVARLLEKEQLALHAGTGGQAVPTATDGDADVPVLRQLLLTASPRLCQSIRRVVRRTRAVLAAKAREQAAGGSGGDKPPANKVKSSACYPRPECPQLTTGSMCVLALLIARDGNLLACSSHMTASVLVKVNLRLVTSAELLCLMHA